MVSRAAVPVFSSSRSVAGGGRAAHSQYRVVDAAGKDIPIEEEVELDIAGGGAGSDVDSESDEEGEMSLPSVIEQAETLGKARAPPTPFKNFTRELRVPDAIAKRCTAVYEEITTKLARTVNAHHLQAYVLRLVSYQLGMPIPDSDIREATGVDRKDMRVQRSRLRDLDMNVKYDAHAVVRGFIQLYFERWSAEALAMAQSYSSNVDTAASQREAIEKERCTLCTVAQKHLDLYFAQAESKKSQIFCKTLTACFIILACSVMKQGSLGPLSLTQTKITNDIGVTPKTINRCYTGLQEMFGKKAVPEKPKYAPKQLKSLTVREIP